MTKPEPKKRKCVADVAIEKLVNMDPYEEGAKKARKDLADELEAMVESLTDANYHSEARLAQVWAEDLRAGKKLRSPL